MVQPAHCTGTKAAPQPDSRRESRRHSWLTRLDFAVISVVPPSWAVCPGSSSGTNPPNQHEAHVSKEVIQQADFV